MAIIVAIINSYSERINRTKMKKRKPYSPYHHKWTPTTITKLYRYFRILLFIELYQELIY